MKSRIVLFALLQIILGFSLQAQEMSTEPSDSVLNQYSIEELLQYKKFYQEQIKVLEEEKSQLRQITIADGEAFIKQHPTSKILDKVYMRLAELYHNRAMETFLMAEQKYDELIALYEAGTIPKEPPVPKKDYSKSIFYYTKLIEEFPHSELVDDAIYNKAYIIEEQGNIDEALESYNFLIQEFPDSRYVPEAHMRIAEHYFNPPINEIERAIEIYKEVLYYKDSPRYDEALYRLGWSYYRLNMYPEAVAYFTLLADDLERSKVLDPTQKYTNPALRDESVEYIGISFLDYGGVEGAASYIKDIGGRKYGIEVLQKVGDVYMNEKEEYEKAINAYQTLLTVYPETPMAPEIQSKIVTCYRYLENDMMAYLARKTLFQNYQPESKWWQSVGDEDSKRNAAKLAEEGVRDNINLLYQRANELQDVDLFSQAVQDSRDYLKVFAKDTQAAQIHWNMALTLDMKLGRRDEAFDEYMKISDAYWDSKYQKWAAENAIALAKEVSTNADSLAAEDRKKSIAQMQDESQSQADLADALNLQPIPLSPEDERLARAYDNYIMLFPHANESSVFLANAGALYYNRNQFPKALKYFNTLVKHFPGSEDVEYARYRIMECYFGKSDYASSEVVARKLKDSAKNTEIAEKAKKRLGESIFLSAEAFSKAGEHLKAGNEYVRVVVEVPNINFADLALFNGALQYDQAKEFRRAVETYDYLIQNYKTSRYRLDAMNNMALDYGELEEYRNAAISYEGLSHAHPDTVQARDALYNASIFFVRAEDWESAIRVNKDYVKRYPNSDDADDLYFDIAGYYLKQDDFEKANEIYGEYAQKYPVSPRVIESYFHRGEFYRRNDQTQLAKNEYNAAVRKNEELKANNIETNDYFAAEALFQLTKLMYYDFVNIEFQGSPEAVDEAKKQKKAMLLSVVENFTNVAKFGTIRLYEATYYIGEAYEYFASSWARQDLPPMDATQRVVAVKEVNQTAASLYERSVKSFTDGVEVLTRIADDYEALIKEKEAVAAAAVVAADSTSDSLNVAQKGGRVTIEDSTLYVARKWIDRSKEKISEIIYDIAELNQESVNEFLAAPVPEGLDAASKLEYRNQVLNRAVRPIIEQIVAAHIRNITVAKELELQNQWVDLSKRKIVATNNILPVEYKRMATDALVDYAEKSKLFMTKTKAGEDAFEVSDQMATLVDYANAFGLASLKLYENTLIKGREQDFERSFSEETEIQFMQSAYNLAMHFDSLATIVYNNRKECEQIFKDTDKIEFEDAIYAYEDNYFTLREAKKAILETGYNVSGELAIANTWTNQVLFELVKTAPEKYKDLLELKSSDLTLISDAAWKVRNSYEEGWTAVDFKDGDWVTSTVLRKEASNTGAETNRIWHVKTDTVTIENDIAYTLNTPPVDSMGAVSQDSVVLSAAMPADSGNVAPQEPTYSVEYKQTPSKKVYFRKTFEISGLPVSADIILSVDDAYNLFLNGEYIAASNADSTEWENESVHQLKDFMRIGKNVLAIEGIDNDGTGNGMKVVLNYSVLADWAEKQKQFKFRVMDSDEKETLIFNKNIIVY